MEISVMQSIAFKEAYNELVPAFERASGHRVNTQWRPSVEVTQRLKDGDVVDLTIMASAVVDELISLGRFAQRFDLARSGVAVAVRKGAPKPDISSAEALKKALLAAKSVAYSTGPSGVYMAGLIEKWGIAPQVTPKATVVTGVPSGGLVARGEVELCFQQMSELLPVEGIDIVGPLPAEIQKTTIFVIGLCAKAPQPAAARELVDFLRSKEAQPVIRKWGMEPIAP